MPVHNTVRHPAQKSVTEKDKKGFKTKKNRSPMRQSPLLISWKSQERA
jgi:hypothetical protein